MNLSKANKISIIGNSAAGKSTLSRELGRTLNINVYTIDKIYWLPEWKLRDQISFRLQHNKWLDKNTWIIDGIGYWEELEQRLAQSDAIIFLDVPVELCKKRAKIRIREESRLPNKNITPGCFYNDVKELQMETIVDFHNTFRPKLMDYLSSINSDKFIIINDPIELNYDNKAII